MTSIARSLAAGALFAFLAVLLLSKPAAAAEPLELGLHSSGLAFGRDIAVAPGGPPVTVEVIEGEAFRVTVSARHPSRSVRASIAVSPRTDCTDPATGLVTTTQPLVARRDAHAGPGQTATISQDIKITKQRHCSVRHEVSASGQAAGLAEVGLATTTFVYHYAARPFGWLDLTSGGPANVRIAGWAIDPETAAPIDVHVYVDGQFAGHATASGHRPDVGAVYRPYGPAHGFDFTVKARPGSRRVCVYAINVGDGGENPELGCRTVNVPLPPACQPIQNEIDGLRAQITQLQAELRFAAPSEKPGLIAEIRWLQAQVTARQADLEKCIAAA